MADVDLEVTDVQPAPEPTAPPIVDWGRVRDTWRSAPESERSFIKNAAIGVGILSAVAVVVALARR